MQFFCHCDTSRRAIVQWFGDRSMCQDVLSVYFSLGANQYILSQGTEDLGSDSLD